MLQPFRALINGLLKLAFRALYYPLAPFYDQISRIAFLGQWAKWQQSVIPRIQGKDILEIGCGTGSFYITLLERGFTPIGIDSSPPMLQQARKKLAKAGRKGTLIQAKVQALPFPDNTFTTVLCTFPTEYILELPALQEITRVLYPGGRLVVVDNAQLRPFNRRARYLWWFYQHILGYGGKPSNSEGLTKFDAVMQEAGLLRRDETFEDEQGEAHIIIATKVW
jgi:ubiquinone/menaquinone biosynthesis C-methylase UbiE